MTSRGTDCQNFLRKFTSQKGLNPSHSLFLSRKSPFIQALFTVHYRGPYSEKKKKEIKIQYLPTGKISNLVFQWSSPVDGSQFANKKGCLQKHVYPLKEYL